MYIVILLKGDPRSSKEIDPLLGFFFFSFFPRRAITERYQSEIFIGDAIAIAN